MGVAEFLGGMLLVGGAACGVIGGIGLFRFPDVFARAHAAGVADTLCALLVMAGLALQAGPTLALAKLFFILVFLWFTSPAATHVLVKAALAGGERPLTAAVEQRPSNP
jgi:multicomponent Na+:H+ antiporter subunit G